MQHFSKKIKNDINLLQTNVILEINRYSRHFVHPHSIYNDSLSVKRTKTFDPDAKKQNEECGQKRNCPP